MEQGSEDGQSEPGLWQKFTQAQAKTNLRLINPCFCAFKAQAKTNLKLW